ncbi:MAG: acyl-CoA dehydrogenase family protein [Myxococcaceae bacterium]|nr:acyl-CoA dehydrogenase family protein [Myxococcaceae bacterium]
MDFGWSQTQRQLFDDILRFARTNLNGDVVARDRNHEFGRKQWERCAEMGLLGLPLPKEFGGLELDHLSVALGLEALGQGCEDTGLVFSIASHLFAAAVPIWKHGSARIKSTILPRMSSGACIGANAVTEAGAGSDPSGMKCRAEKVAQGYVLNGEKSFVTNGPVAGAVVVFAMTNPAFGHLGMSAFVVEAGTKGLTIGSPFEKIGLRTSPTSSIYFEDCLVPEDHLLGEEGQGATILKESMFWERTCEFATWVGSMQRQLDRTVEYARTRKQGRKSIGTHQAVAHELVDMSIRLEAARLLLYRACWLLDQQQPAEKEVCMAKIAISEASIRSSLAAIQIHGANGVVTEYEMERFLRDAVPSTITSGTSEVQRNIISSYLGL